MALSFQCAACREHVEAALFADHFVNNQCIRGNLNATPKIHKVSSDQLLQSTTTGVILGATSTMPVHEGEIILDSARLAQHLRQEGQ